MASALSMRRRPNVQDDGRRGHHSRDEAKMSQCIAENGDPIGTLGKWYRTPLGRHVAAAEGVCLERLLEDAFGLYLLQVGGAEQFGEAVDGSRIRHRIVLAPGFCGHGPSPRITAVPQALPIAGASIDAVLLPHTLDFSGDAHQVLREAERILIPEGRLVVFGFNPLSFWGLMRMVPRRGRRRRVPWCGTQLTPFRLCDWLRLLGFQVEVRQTLVFRPPVSGAYLSQLDWMDGLGARYWSAFGGVYAIRAVKRVTALTPLRPNWRSRRPVLPGRAVEPTARERGGA
jgi:SAM-dependent methyltransferase